MLEPPVTVLAFQKLWLLTLATNSGQRRKPHETFRGEMGNSRKYPYPTTDGFHVLTPPCLRKFQNALPPHALRIP